MSEARYKNSAMLKRDNEEQQALEESGYNEVHGKQRFSGEEALKEIEEAQAIPKELTVDELREHKRNALAQEFIGNQVNEPNNAFALAFKEAQEEQGPER